MASIASNRFTSCTVRRHNKLRAKRTARRLEVMRLVVHCQAAERNKETLLIG